MRGAIRAGQFETMRENRAAVSCYGETSYNFFQKKLAIACGMCYVASVQRRQSTQVEQGNGSEFFFGLLLTLRSELCKFVQASQCIATHA